jgi:UDP-N-acetylmuramoyl-tripeptide--D-alanyl-D-alanine ligase
MMALGWYFITNMQWYSYRFERVILKHHKSWWHITYFATPFILYTFTGEFFWIFFYFGYLPLLYNWNRNLDRKLVITWRVKRYFILLATLTLFGDLITLFKGYSEFNSLLPLILSGIGSYLIEKLIFRGFYRSAEKKLQQMHNLKVIAVTGSYGKTSVKSFLDQVLSQHFKVYSTPKSVNTLQGVVQDINNSLSLDTEIYIVEAGAREQGDIREISKLVKQHFGVITKIGPQHIEYFGDISSIVKTKMEIRESPYLKKLYLNKNLKGHKLGLLKRTEYKVQFFGEEILYQSSTLSGTEFAIDIDGERVDFYTPVLGLFQSENLTLVVQIALQLGIEIADIQKAIAELKPVPHRLEKITIGGKTIIDDGFNGNIDGMLEAFRLVSLYEGRKVLVTPGLVESSDELNEKIAYEIDELFNVVIITGSLNREFFKEKLINKVSQKIFLENKSGLEDVLQKQTKSGDIILFANDAPNFI